MRKLAVFIVVHLHVIDNRIDIGVEQGVYR